MKIDDAILYLGILSVVLFTLFIAINAQYLFIIYILTSISTLGVYYLEKSTRTKKSKLGAILAVLVFVVTIVFGITTSLFSQLYGY